LSRGVERVPVQGLLLGGLSKREVLTEDLTSFTVINDTRKPQKEGV